MNTNKLKVTDLMVGDWVICYHPSRLKSFEKVSVGLLHTMQEQEYGHIKEDSPLFRIVEPVPLTPEILEKNGFEWIKNKIVDEAYVLTKTFYDEPELIIRRFDFNESFVICTSWDDTSFMPIAYVHELQHLLKLCGIDKEIVV